MVCDVDVGRPDATRTHTVEVARLLAAAGFPLELVARGADPRLPGVSFRSAGPADRSLLGRLVAVNGHAILSLRANRRRAGACYLRHYWSLVPSIVAARALGYRLVTQVDDMAYGPGFARAPGLRSWLGDHARRRATAIMARSAAGIVAVTGGIKAILVRDYGVEPAKVLVLPNGVDLDLFAPISRADAIRRSGLDPSCRYALFTGLFADWVDFETMLGGFAEAARARPDARLILAGDGLERARVESLIAAHGLGDRVILTGFVADRSRIRDLLGSATVCLAAHRAERVGHIGVSPTKLAEYLAAGRAIVAVGVPGLREVIESAGAGIVVEADTGAMAAALATLLDDPEAAEAMGRAGRRAAEEGYSWRSVVERTIPLLVGDR